MASPLQPPSPQPGSRIAWTGLAGGAEGLAIARAAEAYQGTTLILADDPASGYRLERELKFFCEDPHYPILTLPDWETLAYDAFSPHQDITSTRLATLHALPDLGRGALVVPLKTAMQRLPPRSFLDGQSLVLKVGDTFDPNRQRQRLEQAGYVCVDAVDERGEFTVRGSLMDIYPMGADLPYRIDLFDQEIESLRTFDPETQRTIDRVDAINLLPAREIPLSDAAIADFRNAWHSTFDVDVRQCPVYQDVSAGIAPSGIEYYLPLFFAELATLFDYLPQDLLVINRASTYESSQRLLTDVEQRYESLRHDVERPILEPKSLFLTVDELFGHTRSARLVTIDGSKGAVAFDTAELPDVAARARGREPAETVKAFVASHADQRTLFIAETPGRREVLSEFLRRGSMQPTDVAGFSAFLSGSAPLAITVAPVERGFALPGMSIITETQIFGARPDHEQAPAGRVVDPDQVVRNLTELHEGAPVVHLENGVGRYRGLTTLDIDGAAVEFLNIEYAEGATLYVPVTNLHLISRYSGVDAEHAPLHRLGSDQWEKAKRRAAEKIVDVAAELLDIYARREAREGVALRGPEDDYYRFADQFPFEATPDQETATDAVITDMISSRPMDRLICGDVGFGKTEVAMRAAFQVVQNGKQVAILVPTTLLAQQHYDSFRDRFADWPVQIDVVSRLRSDGEVAEVQDRLAKGAVDIVIGTHKLLNSAIAFSDLGLVVIDEERLRALRAEVDVLTLPATPIPRTLNMAMGGIRDLSIIATPPAKRLSVKTFVRERRKDLIRESISRELMRGGQVFYLHNEVKTIEETARQIGELVPEARIGVGHGQMPKRRLEQVMSDFYHRRSNVLVCTTIIETGIDIPNANTIIMDRADKFGLAQLHQLRGRVGRSHRQAYAYLLTPHPKAMTQDARKRLEAIEEAGDLGVGFTLATHDLEIRGAGELLGDEQSGQIESIGYSLYMDLLARAVEAIRSGRTPNLDEPLESNHEVNLRVAALIPEDYLPDVHTRLLMYKRIASAASEAELDELKVEMIDRFGLLPQQLRQLFAVTSLKLHAAEIGIKRIDFGPTGGRLDFQSDTQVDPLALVKLVQAEPNTYAFENGVRLRVKKKLEEPAARFEFIEKLLERLRGSTEDRSDDQMKASA
jgi:transcription-repair coupling factor (superfamily II helicase)